MTGLEIVVLAPLAYGVLHLGKKVIEQREIINNQMETLAQQQLALEAQRAAAAEAGGTSHSSEGLLGKAMMRGSLSLAGAVTAYNLYKIRNSRGEQPENSSDESTPTNSNTNTLATSTEVPNQEEGGGPGGDSDNTNNTHNSSNTNSHNNTQPERGFFSTLLTRALSPSSSSSNSSANKRRSKKRTHMPPANYQPQVALSEAEECKVCLHNQRDTLVTPCNHFSLCWECAEAICFGSSGASGRPIGGQCPVCRAPISSLQFAYV